MTPTDPRRPATPTDPRPAVPTDSPGPEDAATTPDAATTAGGPLSGWRVLVPRPPLDRPSAGTGRPGRAGQGGAATTGFSPAAMALLAAGAEPLVVPLVRTVPLDDLTPLDDALLALGAGWYSWLTVTSQAAVAVLADRASAQREDLAELVRRGGARVGAVGPGTARALETLGVRVDVVPPVRSTAVDLVAALTAAAPATDDPRTLFPRGDLAAPTLADGLTAAGWSVDDLVVYRTVPAGPPEPHVAAAWTAGEVHAALLTSASSVRALLDHLGPPPPATRVVVIGPSTEAEARRLGLRVDAVAERQTLAGLVDALATHVRRTGAAPGTPPGATVPPGGVDPRLAVEPPAAVDTPLAVDPPSTVEDLP